MLLEVGPKLDIPPTKLYGGHLRAQLVPAFLVSLKAPWCSCCSNSCTSKDAKKRTGSLRTEQKEDKNDVEKPQVCRDRPWSSPDLIETCEHLLCTEHKILGPRHARRNRGPDIVYQGIPNHENITMCHMVRTLLEICTALNGNPGEMR
jgi:hypothetical protein